MTSDPRKQRIAGAFAAKAGAYDAVADVQWQIAQQLADRIEAAVPAAPARILEIGCGTGFLSTRLADAFPAAELVLTDIAPSMLARCMARLGKRPRYLVVDGEHPEGIGGGFDLIASNLAYQWFVNLGGGLERLSHLLAPGGRMMFATLGRQTFAEWRQAHAALGLACGTPSYPGSDDFPWPAGTTHALEGQLLRHPYADGHDFVRSLKALGASEPAPGYRPLSPGALRRLLASLERGFVVTYHVLYGELIV